MDIIDSKSGECTFILVFTEKKDIVLFTICVIFVHNNCTISIRQLNFSLKAM